MTRRALQTLALVFLTGCSHIPLDKAITTHNIFKQVLVQASDAYSPIYAAAANAALQHDEEADYLRDMAPYDRIVSALRDGKEAQQIIHGALSKCIANNDDRCDLARVGFACAANALDLLSESYGQVRGGATLYAATAIARTQLQELAQGMECRP
jgi:hypothetical protein